MSTFFQVFLDENIKQSLSIANSRKLFKKHQSFGKISGICNWKTPIVFAPALQMMLIHLMLHSHGKIFKC
jgi:hypothetical protein